jgi:hydroxybutyrate-dimer hydrolase
MTAPDFLDGEIRRTVHAGADDLLSAGLGLDGLRALQAPALADPGAPTATELRRRAIHANWRGIADLADPAFAPLPAIPGREYQAFARVPGASQPHRVLAQIPDAFDRRKRCLVVAPSSGSRGVYGAIAFAAPWALPRGCAVVYTDKGTGTGIYDLDSDSGVALDGTRAARGDARLEFEPPALAGLPPHRVAFKHAHSRDNPEADWGRHVLQAAQFGLHALDLAFPEQAPFTPENTRVIAAALSNGGGAVLRAGELADAERWFDAVVAAAPNVLAPGARPLFDYAIEAALYQPCLPPEFAAVPVLLGDAQVAALAATRCPSLRAQGLLDADAPDAQAAEAHARLLASGWEDAALRLARFNLGADVWRSLVATYAQAYARATADAPVCGYTFAALDTAAQPRPTTPAERALWWSDSIGIAPTSGLGVVDGMAAAPDAALPALRCALALRRGDDELARRLRAGIEATRARACPRAPWTLIVHGQDDGLVPIAFTSRAYVAAAGDVAGLRFWEVPRAQHFDAFLALPPMRERYQALIPHAHRALDHAWVAISEGRAPPPSGRHGAP